MKNIVGMPKTMLKWGSYDSPSRKYWKRMCEKTTLPLVSSFTLLVVLCGMACVGPHTHTLSLSLSLCPSPCLSPVLPFLPLPSNVRTNPKPLKPLQIEETKVTVEIVKLVGVQSYHIQVRTPSFSRRFDDVSFEYYSCKNNLARFWDFEAHK